MLIILDVLLVLLLTGSASVANPQSLMPARPKTFLLVATADGRLHALKDQGGTLMWQSSLGFPLMSTKYRQNVVSDLDGLQPLHSSIVPYLDGRAVLRSSQGFQVRPL